MESRLVLVIEGDEHNANQLGAAIRVADYEVVVSRTATAGLDAAIEIKPDCIVCDIDLPDRDGYWVALNIRTHQSAVSVTPFLFLSAHDDPQSRIQGFHVGADVYMTKPYRVEEVVAQVGALVQMAARLRQRRDSLLSAAPEGDYGSTAIEGDLRQMSIATVLSVLGMERRTGVFEVVSKKRRAQIEIAVGYVVHGTIGGTRVSALNAMRVMLAWKVGRFSFTPLPPCEPPPSLRTVQALLLDAAKAEDEAAASTSSSRGFEARLVASSFGGPPSRPDDTGPPSSRAMRDAPVSLTFDLIPSLRAENMPAGEVSAAIDAPLAALERGRAKPGFSARKEAGPRAVPPKPPRHRSPPTPPAPTSGIPVDFEEPLSSRDVESIRVLIDDVEIDLHGGERMLVDERGPNVTPAARAPVPPWAPTPPAGTALGELRRRPAITPPPPATPRTVVIPQAPVPRPPPEKPRSPNLRAQPKKT